LYVLLILFQRRATKQSIRRVECPWSLCSHFGWTILLLSCFLAPRMRLKTYRTGSQRTNLLRGLKCPSHQNWFHQQIWSGKSKRLLRVYPRAHRGIFPCTLSTCPMIRRAQFRIETRLPCRKKLVLCDQLLVDSLVSWIDTGLPFNNLFHELPYPHPRLIGTECSKCRLAPSGCRHA
jgi:hypothetical protein